MSNGPAYATENALRYYRLIKDQVEEFPIQNVLSEDDLRHHPKPTTSPPVRILESCGGDVLGFNAPKSFIMSACSQWQLPPSFIGNILKPGSLTRFEYTIEEMSSLSVTNPSPPKAINIGFRWGPGHSNFIVAFGRYELATSSLGMILSSKEILSHKLLGCNMLDFGSASSLLKIAQIDLQQNPLAIFGVLLDCCQQYIDLETQNLNIEVLATGENMQGIYSRNMAEWIRSWKIKSTKESKRKIDIIYENYNNVTWTMRDCQSLIDIAQQYLQMADELRRTYHYEIPKELVQSIIHRAGFHAHTLDYLEKAIRTQFSYQYNHIMDEDTKLSTQIAHDTKRDSEAMKTIAYLTLVFLPTTFVSAIFSSGALDLQIWRGEVTGRSVVSPGWWVFVLSSLITTILTLGAWLLWKRRILDRKDVLQNTEENV